MGHHKVQNLHYCCQTKTKTKTSKSAVLGVGHQSAFEQLVVAVYGRLSIKVELYPPYFLASSLVQPR